jgi:hypothetical protein
MSSENFTAEERYKVNLFILKIIISGLIVNVANDSQALHRRRLLGCQFICLY